MSLWLLNTRNSVLSADIQKIRRVLQRTRSMETERCSRIIHAGKSNITVLQRRFWDQFNVARPTDNLGLKTRLSFVFLVVNYSIVAVL